jgi:hypothetical protein
VTDDVVVDDTYELLLVLLPLTDTVVTVFLPCKAKAVIGL